MMVIVRNVQQLNMFHSIFVKAANSNFQIMNFLEISLCKNCHRALFRSALVIVRKVSKFHFSVVTCKQLILAS